MSNETNEPTLPTPPAASPVAPTDPISDINPPPVISLISSTGIDPDDETFVVKRPVLDPKALYGRAGEVVYTIEPQSEVSEASLLFQYLIGVGNVIGKKCSMEVFEHHHHCNEFLALIGDSSKARKGTSWALVHSIFRRADPDWARRNVTSGLSTGEGVLNILRDDIKEKKKKKGGKVLKREEKDKRILFYEAEFPSVLKVMTREGNTLAETLKSLWDTGDANVCTKTDPISVSGSHLSIVGHGTKYDVLKNLKVVDVLSGFANRFLFVHTERSKCLRSRGIPAEDMNRLASRLVEVITFVESLDGRQKMTCTKKADKLWGERFHVLSKWDDKGSRTASLQDNIYDTLTNRGEAHVTRLACIYALLDCSLVIKRVHLEAALAAWDYCDQSIQFIFDTNTRAALARDILTLLEREDILGGLPEKVIAGHLKKSQAEVALMLTRLLQKKLIFSEKTRGHDDKPCLNWRITRKAKVLDKTLDSILNTD